ncbi:MAG: nucleoside triphosphate pyrophosphohydrolase [Arachnia propionica]|nr:MAG: nucleoside triphosphate pyrophosphohydrolase [Arachnia propionica]
MARLRVECPWDAKQTHRSLLSYLIEETCEVVDAVEAGSDAELVEELGDLLLQIYFHSQIASEDDRFDLDDVARGISDKLVHRHPHVFAAAETPADVHLLWEARKREEKGRTSSLDGIAESMSSLARAYKVISRARAHGVEVALPDDNVTEAEVGDQIIALVARAQASGLDPDAATRDAVRRLSARIRQAEAAAD